MQNHKIHKTIKNILKNTLNKSKSASDVMRLVLFMLTTVYMEKVSAKMRFVHAHTNLRPLPSFHCLRFYFKTYIIGLGLLWQCHCHSVPLFHVCFGRIQTVLLSFPSTVMDCLSVGSAVMDL